MADGIFAELDISGQAACQLPTEEFEATSVINDITRSTTINDDVMVEEFTVKRTDEQPKSGKDEKDDVNNELKRIFSGSSETVYRYERETKGCVCDQIEAFGCPVRTVSVTESQITVLFIAQNIKTLQQVVRELKEQFETVSIRRLLRSESTGDENDFLFIDRSTLTDRQHEVLSVAHEMGYFAYPREANAEEVSRELDITVSTFSEHLAAGQSKLMQSILSK